MFQRVSTIRKLDTTTTYFVSLNMNDELQNNILMSIKQVIEYRLISITGLTCGSLCLEARACRSRIHWLTVFSNSRAACMASSPLLQVSFCGFCRININILHYITKTKKFCAHKPQIKWNTVMVGFHCKIIQQHNFFYNKWLALTLTSIGCRMIVPPRSFWYFIIFSACSRSSLELLLKNWWKPCSATSGRSKYQAFK